MVQRTLGTVDFACSSRVPWGPADYRLGVTLKDAPLFVLEQKELFLRFVIFPQNSQCRVTKRSRLQSQNGHVSLRHRYLVRPARVHESSLPPWRRPPWGLWALKKSPVSLRQQWEPSLDLNHHFPVDAFPDHHLDAHHGGTSILVQHSRRVLPNGRHTPSKKTQPSRLCRSSAPRMTAFGGQLAGFAVRDDETAQSIHPAVGQTSRWDLDVNAPLRGSRLLMEASTIPRASCQLRPQTPPRHSRKSPTTTPQTSSMASNPPAKCCTIGAKHEYVPFSSSRFQLGQTSPNVLFTEAPRKAR